MKSRLNTLQKITIALFYAAIAVFILIICLAHPKGDNAQKAKDATEYLEPQCKSPEPELPLPQKPAESDGPSTIDDLLPLPSQAELLGTDIEFIPHIATITRKKRK
jgi:hypothetical protein